MIRKHTLRTSVHEYAQISRPHHVNPNSGTARVILAVKNFAAIRGVCHIGLGVTAMNTMKVLRRYGITCEIWAVQTYAELRARLSDDAHDPKTSTITHVVVSAPSWIQPNQFQELALVYVNTEFVQLNHSGCAYLSIDKFGIRNIREVIHLQESMHNVRVAGNNERFVKWASDSFGFQCQYLPNLYDIETFVEPYVMKEVGSTIRIGSFGASRPWKNQLTAAEAAVQVARYLGCDLELYVNSKRPDGGERMIESRLELFDNLVGCKIIEVPWADWPQFRDIVARMHVMFQPSFDETFNVVTADGIAEGVASVTAPSIEWTPDWWQAEPCDPSSLRDVCLRLLNHRHAVHEAREKLKRYVMNGVVTWIDYLLQN